VRPLADEGARRMAEAAVQTRRSIGRIWGLRSSSASQATRRSKRVLGKADLRSQRLARRVSRGDGAKTVIPAISMAKVSMRLVPESAAREDRAALRSLRAEGRSEGRRGQGHAHPQRQAVDHRLRQSVRPRRPAAARFEQGFGKEPVVLPRRWLDPGSLNVPGKNSACRPCCSA